MARPQKKRSFRKIVVDDQSFQWRFNSGKMQGVLEIVAADPSHSQGQRLMIDWGWVDWFEPDYKTVESFAPHIVTPQFVQLAIQRALSLGWHPFSPGADLMLTYNGNDFTVINPER